MAAEDFTYRTRVAWLDTDAGGRIHFTAAFRWAEAAETALRRRLDILGDWEAYPRRRVEAEYLDVLRFDADDRIVEITSFEPHLFPAFGLPLRL